LSSLKDEGACTASTDEEDDFNATTWVLKLARPGAVRAAYTVVDRVMHTHTH